MAKYFEVIAKCGHVGRNYYYEGHFFVVSTSASKAAKRVKNFPRVKKNHKDVILSIKEITYREYKVGFENFCSEPYFMCKNKQQQKMMWENISPIVREETQSQNDYRKRKRHYNRQKRYYEKQTTRKGIRNPYKWTKYIFNIKIFEEELRYCG